MHTCMSIRVFTLCCCAREERVFTIDIGSWRMSSQTYSYWRTNLSRYMCIYIYMYVYIYISHAAHLINIIMLYTADPHRVLVLSPLPSAPLLLRDLQAIQVEAMYMLYIYITYIFFDISISFIFPFPLSISANSPLYLSLSLSLSLPLSLSLSLPLMPPPPIYSLSL